jgi:predicted ester cyclase
MAGNKEIVRRVIEEGYGQGNIEVLDECCASDYVMHEAFGSELSVEGEKRLIETYRSAFPDLHVEIDAIVEEGDTVCVRWTATGTHQGELFGIPPIGETPPNTGLLMVRLEDGKAVEAWQVFDTLTFVQQLRGEAGAEQQPMQEGGAEPSPS